MDDSVLARHERDIVKLKIEIKFLLKRVMEKNAEITKLKEFNRQILGREQQ